MPRSKYDAGAALEAGNLNRPADLLAVWFRGAATGRGSRPTQKITAKSKGSVP
jgi:hypothetical protein